MFTVRAAGESDVQRLAQIWYDGWLEAHAPILPAELARHRTLESFQHRLREALPTVRTAGPAGEPAGLCMVKGDELYQLYVDAGARGSGLAAALLGDGEQRIAASGSTIAWLACAIGNDRAARFYEKHGWHRAGVETIQLPTPDGPFALDVWRYEKDVSGR